MRYVLCVIAGLCLSAGTFAAPSPKSRVDDTPATNNVCDPLRAEGVTRGLYGLCVAFCEAQDLGNSTMPETRNDYAAMLADAPAGRLLDNYNRRKADTDPDMPCIVTSNSCPCWSTSELNAIDGVSEAGASLTGPRCRIINPTIAGVEGVSADLREYQSDRPFNDMTRAYAIDVEGQINRCSFETRSASGERLDYRRLQVQSGTLSKEQALECYRQLSEVCSSIATTP